MRKFLIFALCLISLQSFTGHAFAFTDAEKADLTRASAYLNALKSAQGKFLQIGPSGKPDEGTLYLQKPGRMRFEYKQPNPLSIVSNGDTIAVQNSKLRTVDRYPLVESPLKMLLSENVNLATDRRVVRLHRETGALTVLARQTTGYAQGSIAITFADSKTGGLELRQWEVTDAQGLHTIIILSDLKKGVALDSSLFTIRNADPFRGRPH